MIVHTLIFSFGEGRTQAEQDKFLATVADISLKSGLCTRVETRKHLPLPNDAYAPVFVASAVTQLFCPSLEAVDELSGGNQQKVTVARALVSHPTLIVAITPTRGVDVASKELLLTALADVTRSTGASLLLASDEFDDLQICDRVVVLVRGQVFTEFTGPPYDNEELIAATEGLLAMGET